MLALHAVADVASVVDSTVSGVHDPSLVYAVAAWHPGVSVVAGPTIAGVLVS